MTRRTFFLSPLAAKAQASRRKILIILVDGFDPAYFEASDIPNLRRLAREGGMKIGEAVIPTVTNVNNASVVTGCFPSEHGIVSNYYYDRATQVGRFMETPDFLLKPTIFEFARKQGLKSALVSAKDKVRSLLSSGAEIAISSEKSRSGIIYTPEANYFAVRKAHEFLQTVDLVYLSTTDYMMHTYPPSDARSLEHLHMFDKLLGELVNDFPKLELSLTADHGMNAKMEAIDLARLLAARRIDAEAVPIVRDQHVVHHQNLGGACYIFLRNAAQQSEAEALLRETKGITEVYNRADSARRFHLHPDRIGDIFVLGDRHVAFGALNEMREPVKVRTHGSRFEVNVPLLWYNRKLDPARLRQNLDLTRLYFESHI